MTTKPLPEHAWLNKLVGEWTIESEAVMKPGEPPVKSTGTERVRSLGGLWIVGESEGEMPTGGHADMILTLGYDPIKKRYVGTWIGNMMANFWVYDGAVDASQTRLVLDTEGPGMDGSGTAKYQDIHEIKSDDYRIMTSQVLGPDGQWIPFMTAHYRRRKPD